MPNVAPPTALCIEINPLHGYDPDSYKFNYVLIICVDQFAIASPK